MRKTEVRISLDAIVANAQKTQAACQADALCAVIKADAYGHGALAVGRALRGAGVAFLAVALVEEARALRQSGLLGPILVLGADYRGAEEVIVQNHLTVAASSLDELRRLSRAAVAQGRIAAVHLELDCGMARLGARPEDMEAVAREAAELPGVQVTGLMAHLTHADVPNAPESRAQVGLLEAAHARIAPLAPALAYVHIVSSGALVTVRTAPHRLARCGLSIYGIEPLPAAPLGLEPALSWHTRPVSLRTLRTGEAVSYGSRWRAARPSRIATLPVGYADGYPRLLGQRGAEVLICGRRAPIVGTICMDLCMVDVTDVPAASLDDDVVLLGTQGTERIDAHAVGRWADTIPYEILSGIGNRVPRTYVGVHADR